MTELAAIVPPAWTRNYEASGLAHPAVLRAFAVPFKVINGCEEPVPMLVRYRLFVTPWGSLNIHRFLRSDYDRAVHDHPFSFVSLILRGQYDEHLPVRDSERPGYLFNDDGTPVTIPYRRFAGDLLRRPARWAHRVQLVDGKPAWTLIWIGRKCREWGFFTPAAWIPWREYHVTAGCLSEESA